MANISVFVILARIFLIPLKKFLHYDIIYIVIIIMASDAGLLLFIPILDSLMSGIRQAAVTPGMLPSRADIALAW